MRIAIKQAKISVPAEAAIDGIDYVSKPSGGVVGSVYRVPITQTLGRVRVAIMQPAGPETCEYILNMHDSYGDGWNGATLAVYVDDVLYGTFSVPEADESYEATETIIVDFGSEIRLVYSSGSYESENSYELMLAGDTLFSDGPRPATGESFAHTCGCAQANFTFAVDPMSYAVTFTDTSLGVPIEWYWAFGDTGTANDQHPIHAYPGPGTYDAQLTIYDGVCPASSVTKTIEMACVLHRYDNTDVWVPEDPQVWDNATDYLQFACSDGNLGGVHRCICSAELTGDFAVDTELGYSYESGILMNTAGMLLFDGTSEYYLHVGVADGVPYIAFTGPDRFSYIFQSNISWDYTEPIFVRYICESRAVSAYYSLDGTTWQFMGTFFASENPLAIGVEADVYWQDGFTFIPVFTPCL